MKLNPNHISTDLLKLPAERTRLDTDNFRTFMDYAIEADRKKNAICFVSEPGYGALTAFNKYKKTAKQSNRVYVVDISKGMSFKQILINILSDNVPASIVNFSQAAATHLLSSANYLLHKTKHKNHLLLLRNIQNLNTTGYDQFYQFIANNAGNAGIAYTINSQGYDELLKSFEKNHPDAEFFKKVHRVVKMEPPRPEELGEICFKRGILHKDIIKSLVDDTYDFKTLNFKIEQLKEKLRLTYGLDL
jgi:hypothetical protein